MREGWTYKKLGEITDTLNGLWTGKKPPFINVAVIRNTNFTKNCELDMTNVAYLDVEQKQYATRKLLCGDIIIEKSGGTEKQPVGRAVLFNIPDGEYSFSNFTSTLRIIDNEEVDSAYLHKFLQAKYSQGITLSMQSKTTGIHNLNLKAYKNINVPLPSIGKQQSIVSELDKINELISLKKSQLSGLDALAQSIFYDMFGDPVENEKGWEVKKLGDLTEVGTGSTPDRNNESYYKGNNPWIKSTEVSNCIISDVQEHISNEALAETNCTLYPVDTILMAMYGQGKTRGQIAIMKIVACTNQAVAAILPSNNLVPNYLYQHLLLMYENIRSMARGGNQANLNLSLVKSIKIMLPPLSLQQTFAKRIEAIEQQKQQISSTIRDLETLLASRMQYWFD